jgi:uncharacterized membrane protein (DUF2068 family)
LFAAGAAEMQPESQKLSGRNQVLLWSRIALDQFRTTVDPPETKSDAVTHATNRRDQGVRAIIAYKTIKASAQLAVAAVLLCLWPFGLTERVESAAQMLHARATQMWARHLSELLLRHATQRALAFVLLALAVDGAFTAVEAFALRRDYPWAPWLVVLATSLLLPFELFELLKEPHLSRLAVLLVNLAMAGYLARSALQERRSPATTD